MNDPDVFPHGGEPDTDNEYENKRDSRDDVTPFICFDASRPQIGFQVVSGRDEQHAAQLFAKTTSHPGIEKTETVPTDVDGNTAGNICVAELSTVAIDFDYDYGDDNK